MPPAAIIAGVGLAVSAFGTIKSIQAQKKQTSAQNRALDAQRKQDEIRQTSERRRQIRAARVQAAQSQQAAVNQGVQTSSAASGASGSIQSQLATNLGTLNTLGSLSDQATAANQQANIFDSRAQTYGSIANIGGTIFSTAVSDSDRINSFFKS
jgi:hypothetical protein